MGNFRCNSGQSCTQGADIVTDDVDAAVQDTLPPRSEEEIQRALLAAKEAKTTIVAVAALAIGGIIFMFLITLVIVVLKVL